MLKLMPSMEIGPPAVVADHPLVMGAPDSTMRRQSVVAAGLIFALVLTVLSLAVDRLLAAPSAFDPATGYRISDLAREVPPNSAATGTVTVGQAKQQFAAGAAIFIDVMPVERNWLERASTAFLGRVAPHQNIPGSLWLPNAGKGQLSASEERRFASLLQHATRGQPDRPVVFYCKTQCWASWNAARRAALAGYTAATWLSDAHTTWELAGLPTRRGVAIAW